MMFYKKKINVGTWAKEIMETLYLPIKKMAFHHVTQQPCKKILHFFFSVNFHILVTKKKMKKEKEKRPTWFL
jgi:hypothetical protein